MSSCRGCGSVLDPTQEEVNQAVDDVLVASIEDAKKHGEICPLCGHSQAQSIHHRKTVQFGLLLAIFIVAATAAVGYYKYRQTERQGAAQQAVKQLQSDAYVTQVLGSPLSIEGKVTGQVKHDETGWQEVKSNFTVRGPKGRGTAQIVGGRQDSPWVFTTLEVVMPQLKKKVDVITGRIIEYDPDAYIDTHTEAPSIPEYALMAAPPSHWNGYFPCVYATATPNSAPQAGSCTTPVPMSRASRTPVDRFETDLRTGKFIMRQTDLSISEAGFEIPLTRTYTADDWVPRNKSHAFGMNSNHPYDIAPLGTRNPYTEQFIVLEDGDILYFPRVSRGGGYPDAVFRQSEVGNSFYNATQKWDGTGWLTQLRDGSTIHFPESYSARNLAQGAPTEMVDSTGNKIELIRDPKRNLQEVRGPDGASIKLQYDDHDRIVRAEKYDREWTKYAYDSAGFLTSAIHSGGTARYYFYEGGLLTWVRDEQNRLLLHNVYAGTWLIRQQFGNGEAIQYLYNLSANKFYAGQVSLTFSDGSVKTIPIGDSVSEVYKRMH
jgi:YD repeat-containing protein